MNLKHREKNLNQIHHKTTPKEIILIALGSFLVAFAIHVFLVPSNLSTGGASGLAIVLNYIFKIGVGPLFVIVNIFLFILGFVIIGKDFGVNTVLVPLGLSGLVWIMEVVFPITKPISDDTLLMVFLGTLIQGVGVGIVLNQYTSTGGTDIIAKIFQKFFGLDLGIGCLIADFAVTLGAGFAFGLNTFLYSVVGVIVNGVMVGVTIDGLNTSKLIFINTREVEKVCDFIVQVLDRSANKIPYEGAFSKKESVLVETVVSRREYIRLKEFVHEIDDRAFVVVSSANEVLGENWRRFKD